MNAETAITEKVKLNIGYSVLVKEIHAGWTACGLDTLNGLVQALSERLEDAPETADWIWRLGYFSVSSNLKEYPASISMKQRLDALQGAVTDAGSDAPKPCYDLLGNRPWTTLELLQCNISYFRICQDIEEHRLKQPVAFLDAILALAAQRIDASDNIEVDGLLFPEDAQACHLLQMNYERMVYALRHTCPAMLETAEGRERILKML